MLEKKSKRENLKNMFNTHTLTHMQRVELFIKCDDYRYACRARARERGERNIFTPSIICFMMRLTYIVLYGRKDSLIVMNLSLSCPEW